MILRLMWHDPVATYLKAAVPAYLAAGIFAGTVSDHLPSGLGTAPMLDFPGLTISLYITVWGFLNFALVPSGFWVRSRLPLRATAAPAGCLRQIEASAARGERRPL